MRLIDADLLRSTEQIEKAFSKECDELYGILQLIDEQPTIEKPQWIPCSERLPNKNGYYLVTQLVHSIKDFSKVLRHEVEYVEFMQERWCRARHLEVIAWQPLPKPYKDETK